MDSSFAHFLNAVHKCFIDVTKILRTNSIDKCDSLAMIFSINLYCGILHACSLATDFIFIYLNSLFTTFK